MAKTNSNSFQPQNKPFILILIVILSINISNGLKCRFCTTLIRDCLIKKTCLPTDSNILEGDSDDCGNEAYNEKTILDCSKNKEETERWRKIYGSQFNIDFDKWLQDEYNSSYRVNNVKVIKDLLENTDVCLTKAIYLHPESLPLNLVTNPIIWRKCGKIGQTFQHSFDEGDEEKIPLIGDLKCTMINGYGSTLEYCGCTKKTDKGKVCNSESVHIINEGTYLTDSTTTSVGTTMVGEKVDKTTKSGGNENSSKNGNANSFKSDKINIFIEIFILMSFKLIKL